MDDKGASSPDSTRFGSQTSRGPLATSSPASAPLCCSPPRPQAVRIRPAPPALSPITSGLSIEAGTHSRTSWRARSRGPQNPRTSVRSRERVAADRGVPATSLTASFPRPQQRNAPVVAVPGTRPRPVSAPLFVVPPVLFGFFFKPAHVPVDPSPVGIWASQQRATAAVVARDGGSAGSSICLRLVCVWLAAAQHRGSFPLLPTRLHPPCAQHGSGHGERESRDFSILPASTLPTLRRPCHDRVACPRCWGERAVGASCWGQPRGPGPPTPTAGVPRRHRVCRGAARARAL